MQLFSVFYLLLVLVIQIHGPLSIWSTEFMLTINEGKALHGFSFVNITETTMENCLERCLADCLCMSFQMCDNKECQLCSSNNDLNATAMLERKGCVNYSFDSKGITQVASNDQCDSSCRTVVNCCLTSNPCLNNATCVPSSPPNNRRRFQCLCVNGYHGDRCETPCPAGYTGQRCEQPIRSCRGYSNRVSGKYIVLDDNDQPFKVHCDFDNSSSLAWTLLQPYQVSYKDDFSISGDEPAWSKYVLSESRIESIRQDSTKWRLTCQYDVDGLVHTDCLLQASTDELNNLIFKGCGECIKVKYINVRWYNTHIACTVYMVQKNNIYLHVEVEAFIKGGDCVFKLTKLTKQYRYNGYGITNADSLGCYRCARRASPKHCCCSLSSEATTQTWLGGEN